MILPCDQCGYREEAFATGFLWVNTSVVFFNGRALSDWRMHAIAVCSEFCAMKFRRDNKVPCRFVAFTDGGEVAPPDLSPIRPTMDKPPHSDPEPVKGEGDPETNPTPTVNLVSPAPSSSGDRLCATPEKPLSSVHSCHTQTPNGSGG